MPNCRFHPPLPRPEPFSPLPLPGHVPDWGKWIRDRLAEKGALLAFPSASEFPDPGAQPNVYEALDTGTLYRWDGVHYQVLVDPSAANDVLEYEGRGRFPETGEHGKLYIAADTGSIYRWGGEGYVALLPGKADKVGGATAGNLAALTQDGNLMDSGAKPADFATAAQGAKADTAVQPAAIAGFVDGAEYDAEYGDPPKPTILLKHGNEVVATVDATDFIKDGMVSDVKIVGGNLVITFNTDSGKQPIEIPLTDIFDPANYYDKDAVDALLDDKQDALTFDNAPTSGSNNPVKSGGIWSALWGALASLPTGFTSLYDWCVAQLAGKLNRTEAIDGFTEWEASSIPSGYVLYSCTYNGNRFWDVKLRNIDPSMPGVAQLVFGGPNATTLSGTGFQLTRTKIRPTKTSELTNDGNGNSPFALAAEPNHTGNLAALDANGNPTDSGKKPGDFQSALSAQQLANVAAVSDALAFDATRSYAAGDPVVYDGALYTFTAAHTGAWAGTDASAVDIIARLAGKADDNAVVKLTGDQTIGGNKTFTGYGIFYDFTVSHPQGQGYVRIYALANENRVHIDFSDVVSGSHGALFLPVLGAYSAATLAAIENIAPDAFLMLYDGATVNPNTLYCYQGRLYRCVLGYTFQSGDSYPSDDTTHWALATVEDVLAALRTGKQDALTSQQLANIAAVPNKANASDLRYAISESIPLTVTSGAAATTLDDRTHNVRTVAAPGTGNTTTITATLPPIVQGKSRDMFLNLTVGSAASDAGDISLSIVEPSGATVQIDIGSVEDIGIGKNEILISENALPTTSGNVTTTHWLVTVRHEDFAS